MTEDKQIKELAEAISKSPWRIEQDHTGCHINSAEIAEALYNEGYCKASEIFEAVDNLLELVVAMTGMEFTYMGKYAELKKKYSGKDIDVPTKRNEDLTNG
jgi:hypothetical protein